MATVPQQIGPVCCSEDPDVKGTETLYRTSIRIERYPGCSEDPDVKGTETIGFPPW